MCRLLPCRLPSDPGTGFAPQQPGTLHRPHSIVPSGTSPRAGWEPGLGASSISFTQTLPTVEQEGCSQALGTAHSTPAQPLPDPIRRLWGRCSLPATSWESLSMPYFKRTLYTHKLHEKWSRPVETMPTRKNQSLHCRPGVITEEFVSGSQRHYLLCAKHSEDWESPYFDGAPKGWGHIGDSLIERAAARLVDRAVAESLGCLWESTHSGNIGRETIWTHALF